MTVILYIIFLHVPHNSQTGRGIAVYSHKLVEKSILHIKPRIAYDEICLLEIKLRGGDLMLFGCAYRSPTPSETSSHNNEQLNTFIRNLSTNRYSHKCILGDFNYKDINWETCTTIHHESSKEAKFLDAVKDCFLTQHNLENSRRRGNDDPSLIDLIFTDENMQVSDILHEAPLGKSDHDVIIFTYNCYLDYSKTKERYVYSKADYNAMRNELNDSGWKDEFEIAANNSRIEDLWAMFRSKLNELRVKFVPKTKETAGISWKEIGGFPIDRSVQSAIRSKHKLHRTWMSAKGKTDSEEARLNYRKASNKVKKLIRQAKRRYEASIANQCKANPKVFWSRGKLKTKEGVAPLLKDPKDPNSTKFTDKEKADILQEQFASVFTYEPDGNIPALYARTNKRLSNVVVTEKMVIDEISALDRNKSADPNDIHPLMLKELALLISRPIVQLLNKSLKEGIIPLDWKIAFVTPIYKKGKKNIAENYRPISITSLICRLLERFISKALMNHLLSENLLSNKQFGFIPQRSTITQLLLYLNKCIDEIVDRNVVDTIYLDFSKAFDSVPHKRLLSKLLSYGISGNTRNWIESFLKDRTQEVIVNGCRSDKKPVLSGIPQGSVLGPVLFIIYINDILDEIESDGLLFADDAKIFRKIADDAKTLQKDLEKL